MKRLELCRPCAEKLKEAYTVKPAGGIAKKIDCQQCGKRRYGVTYQIEKKQAVGPGACPRGLFMFVAPRI